MDLANHIKPAHILSRLRVRDWTQLSETLSAAVAADPGGLGASGATPPDPAASQSVHRAPLFVAPNGAVLHDRRASVADISLALALLEKPLALPDDDGTADVVLYIVSGPGRSAWALKAAGHFRNLLADAGLRDRLSTMSPEALHAWLAGLDLRLDAPVLARDIMRPPLFKVFVDTPVTEVTRLMEKHRSNAIAVVDHEEHIVGEITSNRLFKLGIPEFFERLASISFIREFDPFEHYYSQTGQARAGEVMTTDFTTVPEDATIMEVVFALTVQNHRKIYVVRDGRRVGVIDRVEIINKVLNF
jgi:CBS domain-containing protein